MKIPETQTTTPQHETAYSLALSLGCLATEAGSTYALPSYD